MGEETCVDLTYCELGNAETDHIRPRQKISLANVANNVPRDQHITTILDSLSSELLASQESDDQALQFPKSKRSSYLHIAPCYGGYQEVPCYLWWKIYEICII